MIGKRRIRDHIVPRRYELPDAAPILHQVYYAVEPVFQRISLGKCTSLLLYERCVGMDGLIPFLQDIPVLLQLPDPMHRIRHLGNRRPRGLPVRKCTGKGHTRTLSPEFHVSHLIQERTRKGSRRFADCCRSLVDPAALRKMDQKCPHRFKGLKWDGRLFKFEFGFLELRRDTDGIHQIPVVRVGVGLFVDDDLHASRPDKNCNPDPESIGIPAEWGLFVVLKEFFTKNTAARVLLGGQVHPDRIEHRALRVDGS